MCADRTGTCVRETSPAPRRTWTSPAPRRTCGHVDKYLSCVLCASGKRLDLPCATHWPRQVYTLLLVVVLLMPTTLFSRAVVKAEIKLCFTIKNKTYKMRIYV